MSFSFEYTTHGGFEMVRDAWLFVSNIFNNPDYQSFAVAIALATLFFSALAGLLRGRFRSFEINQWMWSSLVIILMWGAFFQTGFGSWNFEGDIVVYDDVKNLNQPISDLPPGIVALAGALNSVQIGMENLIESVVTGPFINDTTEVVLGVKMLRDSAGGQLLTSLYASLDARYIDSLDMYIDNCLITEEMNNPEIKNRLNHTDNLEQVFSAGANPALYTTTYLDTLGNPINNSEVTNCLDAWDRIKNYNANYNNIFEDGVKRFCQTFGFGSAGTSYTACRTILSNAITNFVSASTSNVPEDFSRNILYAARYNNYLMKINSSSALTGIMSSVRTQSSLIGTGIAAESWIPHLKIILEVVIIALTPLIFLFIVSTFSLNAIFLLFGFWIFLVTWAVLDKILETFWISYAIQTWDTVKNFAQVGLSGQEQFWVLASKNLAVLGALRTKGLLLAGILVGMLFRFGGSALAHFAAGALSTASSAGSLAGGALSPEKTVQKNIATSWMNDTAKAGEIAEYNMDVLFRKGKASAMKTYSEAAGWGNISSDTAVKIGEQNMRSVLAQTKARSQFSNEALFDAAIGSLIRSIPMGAAARGVAEKTGTSYESAAKISSGTFNLGSILNNPEARKKWAELLRMPEEKFRKLAPYLYVKPKHSANGTITGIDITARLPKPELVREFAETIRSEAPIAAAGLQKIAEEGKGAVFTGSIERGEMLAGEGKSGNKIRALDLAYTEKGSIDQLHDREEVDISRKNPRTIFARRGALKFVGGKYSREGDKIAIRDGITEDGLRFRELVLDRKTGKVIRMSMWAEDGRKALDGLEKLGMKNPDYMTAKQVGMLKKAEGPVRVDWSGAGRTEIGWETTKKDLVTEKAGEIKEFKGLSGGEIIARLKDAGEWKEFKERFGEAAKILEENPDAKFDMTTSGKVNLDQQRTVFSALNSFTRGREDIFRDKKVVDAPRGFANTEAVAAYLYARQDSIIPKIIGKNAWKDLPYNLNTILQTSDYISRFVDHDASILQSAGIGVNILAKLGSEEKRKLSRNLHYTALAALDYQARSIAETIAQSPQEKMEAYSELRQDFFLGYAKLMELFAKHPDAVWDDKIFNDVKEMALNTGISKNVIDTFELIRKSQGLVRIIDNISDSLKMTKEAQEAIINSLFLNPQTRENFKKLYEDYPYTEGAEKWAKSIYSMGGIKTEN